MNTVTLEDAVKAVDLIKRREQFMKENPPAQFMKENPPAPPEIDTEHEVSYEMLKDMIGQPVFDSRLSQWVLVESVTEQGDVWLRGINKIHFPIVEEYTFLNPLFCMKR